MGRGGIPGAGRGGCGGAAGRGGWARQRAAAVAARQRAAGAAAGRAGRGAGGAAGRGGAYAPPPDDAGDEPGLVTRFINPLAISPNRCIPSRASAATMLATRATTAARIAFFTADLRAAFLTARRTLRLAFRTRASLRASHGASLHASSLSFPRCLLSGSPAFRRRARRFLFLRCHEYSSREVWDESTCRIEDPH